jgi:hypothetical protein
MHVSVHVTIGSPKMSFTNLDIAPIMHDFMKFYLMVDWFVGGKLSFL